MLNVIMLNVVMQNVVMQNVVILNIIMLNVVMLNVVAPKKIHKLIRSLYIRLLSIYDNKLTISIHCGYNPFIRLVSKCLRVKVL